MKISNVSAFALRFMDSEEAGSPYHLPREGWRSVSPGAHEAMVVRIETDEGVFGYGEGQSPVSPDTTKTIVDDLCTPFLLGKDPFDVEFLWQRLYSAMRERGHPTGFYMDALAACDIAIWDILGKAAGKPVHKILGGRYRDRVRLYAGIGGPDPEKAADRATEFVTDGYDALKLHLPIDRRKVLPVVAAVRERVGPDVDLMVDLHTQYSVSDAINIGRGLEELDAFWLEAPTVPEDIQGQVEIARALDIQIANGEWSRTRYEMREAFERRTCDVTMPDIGRTGLTEGKRIAILADTYNIPFSPHIGGGGILAIAASIQLSAAIPNFIIMEHSPGAYASKCRITHSVPQPADGAFILDDTPGLGVDVDDRILETLSK
ncbi:MAG: mandelate racemase/muconate lactonizing enzyme family protein [Gemmatimonadota bacterium]|nr:mandelate racemase/muconate lactonizing enzyme family protein [Gemmatimonadota bacterium]